MPINLLFVEDEADLRSVVTQALSDQGFAVTPASDGIEAIAQLRGETQYAVVVTDVSMPGGVSGLEVAAAVAETQPGARVLVVSGLQRSQLPHSCVRAFSAEALPLQTAHHCDPRTIELSHESIAYRRVHVNAEPKALGSTLTRRRGRFDSLRNCISS